MIAYFVSAANAPPQIDELKTRILAKPVKIARTTAGRPYFATEKRTGRASFTQLSLFDFCPHIRNPAGRDRRKGSIRRNTWFGI